jgi:SAM-dependent methyltransferase
MAWSQEEQAHHKLKEYAEIFDARGRDYHEAMLRFPEARDDEFANIIKYADLSDGQTVCDYPSGGGYLEDYLNHDVNLILLENSQVFLQCAIEHSNAKRLLVENYKIPMADGSADRFISLAGLHHVDDKTVVFAEIYRCLKHGGKFAVADVRVGSGAAGFLNEFVHENSEAGHEGIFLHEETKKELESCGYTVSFAQPIAYSWQFASVDDMVEYCRLMFGINRANPQKIEDAIRHYLGLWEKDGEYYMGWELMFIVAQK